MTKPRKSSKASSDLSLIVGGGSGGLGATASQMSKEVRDLARKMVASEATDEEFALFIHFCINNNVNPLDGEAWFQIRHSKKKDRDGNYMRDQGTGLWLYERKPVFGLSLKAIRKRLEARPDYRGHKVQAVYTNDGFEYDSVSDIVKHTIKVMEKKQRGSLLGAWCKLERKGKLPMIKILYLTERKQDSRSWNNMGDTMITKCVEMDAIRAAYPVQFGAIYVPEERENDDEISTAQFREILREQEEKRDKAEREPRPEPERVDTVREQVTTEEGAKLASSLPVIETTGKVVEPEEDKPDDDPKSPYVSPQQFGQLENIMADWKISPKDLLDLCEATFKSRPERLGRIKKPIYGQLVIKFEKCQTGELEFKRDPLRFEGPPKA